MIRYQKIRDSKIDWIGKIPSHWNVDKIKYIFFQRKEKNNPIQTDNILSLTIKQGIIPISEKKSGGNKPKDDLSKYNLTYEGDIVMNSMNVIVGSVGISNYFGVVSPVYYILRQINSQENIRYYHHLFRTQIFQKSLIGLGNGILIKKSESSGKLNTIRMRIPIDKLNQVLIPHPPINEQKKMVSFIDIKTQKIDKLIEKTEKKIKFLKDKRISLINHCVTKGLNPDVDMKDSGVEWIGEIPKNWGLVSLKYLFEIRKRISGELGYDVLSVTQKGLKVKDLENFQGQHSMDYSKYQLVYKDEFVMNHMDLLTGFVDLSKQTGVTSPDYRVFGKIKNTISDFYYLYIFQLCYYKKIFYGLGRGVSSFGRWRLPSIEFKFFKLPFPSLSEQTQIVEHLDEQTQKIDSTIKKETQRVELLKEYRQSLISEVVTGKVDVRDYNG